jgi:hypothetical protein
MLTALFGIGNDALNLAVNLLVLSAVLVYFALVAWTFFDARRRVSDPVLVASSVGASFVFPFIGTIIYSILRPPEFLEDAHEREVETRAAELRVRQLSEQSCPNCEYPVEKSYLRCPNCRARLKDPCGSCGKPVDPRWALCPYCETPVQRRAPQRRAERREGPRPAPQARPSREPQPVREQRRAAGAQPRASSRQGQRPTDQQRRTGSRRPPPPKAGSTEKSEQPDEKQETGRRASDGTAAGEERPRAAPAS